MLCVATAVLNTAFTRLVAAPFGRVTAMFAAKLSPLQRRETTRTW